MRWIAWALGIALVAQVVHADEQERRARRIPQPLAERLSRVLLAESDGSQSDWAALLWTIKHRRDQLGISWESASAYSVPLKGTTERARLILALGTVTPPSRARQRHWLAAQQFVQAWALGRIVDPCPQALHWRSHNDPMPSRSRIVLDCGDTRNEFFYYEPTP